MKCSEFIFKGFSDCDFFPGAGGQIGRAAEHQHGHRVHHDQPGRRLDEEAPLPLPNHLQVHLLAILKFCPVPTLAVHCTVLLT